MTSHYTRGVRDHTTWSWTLSFGLSRSHGHGSRLVCEVALTVPVYKDAISARNSSVADKL